MVVGLNSKDCRVVRKILSKFRCRSGCGHYDWSFPDDGCDLDLFVIVTLCHNRFVTCN